MAMHEMYRDFLDGSFVPEMEISQRQDNGHYVAKACGLTVTHHDRDQAVNSLAAKIQDGLLRGEIHPGS